jgi:hypothetical protein
VRWYGKYVQSARIEINGVFLAERDLKDEANIVSLSIPRELLQAKDNVVHLKFRYQQWFPGVPIGMTAAFLDKVEAD